MIMGIRWMTISDVAAYLKVSRKTVSRLPIPHSRIGRLPRYSQIAVDRFLSERETVTKPPDLAVVRPHQVSLKIAPQRPACAAGKARHGRADRLLKLLTA